MEILSGDIANQIFIDSVLFYIAIIIAFLYIHRKHKGIERIGLYIFTIITYSITNIFIKPVQDYLIPIPRTFIFYYKVIGSFSIYDIFLVTFFIYILLKYFSRRKYRNYLKHGGLLSSVLYYDFAIIVISFLGLLLYWLGNNPIDFNTQIRSIRPLFAAISAVFIGLCMIKKYKNENEIKIKQLITSFCLLNFINIISQFISSFFLQGISWERAGHSVVLLDQSEGILTNIYVPLIFCFNRFIPKWIIYSGIFITGLQFYNGMKLMYFAIGVTLFIMLFMGINKGYISKRLFNFSFIGCIFIILFSFSFSQKSSNSLDTRIGQNESLFESLINNPINIVCGVGDGGMIKRQNKTEDDGESRAIDREKTTINYTTTYQVPILNTIKVSGLIGFLLSFILFFKMIRYAYSLIKYGWCYCFYISFFAVRLFLGTRFIYSDTQIVIFYVESYIIFALLLEIEKRKLNLQNPKYNKQAIH